MTKTMRMFSLAVAAGGLAISASATTYNLGDLVDSHGTITIGDKIFGDFGYASALIPDPHDATVTPSIEGGVYYLTFQGPWVAAFGELADIALQYSVATTSGQPLINMIDQSYVLSVGGTGGFILIGETVRTGSFVGPTTAQSSVSFSPAGSDLEDPEAEPVQGDDLIVNPAQAKLYVTKDIFFGANAAGIIGPTTIRQSFHQAPSIPDGGLTVLMLGFAISGFGLVRRRSVA